MRKKALKFIAVALTLVVMTTPISVSAAWDRLDDDSDSGGSIFGSGFGSDSGSSSSSSTYPYSGIKKQISEYAAVNSDVIGWLKVPGTNINEPIVQSKQSNSYYVARDWKGTNYPNNNWQNYTTTATYLDYRGQLGAGWKQGTSRNLVLYGHNWNNLRTPFVVGNKTGYTMFAQLPSYNDINFAKQNSHIYFSTGENEGVWRVFSVAYCELSKSFFYNNSNPSADDFTKLIKELQDRSIFDFGVEVDNSDRILTLSTCTRQYNVGENQRFIVVARLLRDGESESDSVSVAINSDVKVPKFS